LRIIASKIVGPKIRETFHEKAPHPMENLHAFPIVNYKKNFHLNGGRSTCDQCKVCVNIDA
jgi:hypothetical protein